MIGEAIKSPHKISYSENKNTGLDIILNCYKIDILSNAGWIDIFIVQYYPYSL